MKNYKINGKSVRATNIVNALTLYDEASCKDVIQALIVDEESAIASYDLAIENLGKKLPQMSLKALVAIRDDERRHIQNLLAILNDEVTEQNLEDGLPDIRKYQQWVDYDMARYGQISADTNEELEKAGLTIVKDKYGDYQVIPKGE